MSRLNDPSRMARSTLGAASMLGIHQRPLGDEVVRVRIVEGQVVGQ